PESTATNAVTYTTPWGTIPTSETELRLTALSNCAKRIRAAAAELGAILAQSRTQGSAAARSIV
ncbi:hypothetical protein, partial [Mesorhizobium sp.]|uniref:hypothetical protein n=1 Tax=Mesorhizobium sp. TaxID=1871066 RepID=UPI00257E7E9C